MPTINLSNNFEVCPEGHYTFKIEEVEYDEEFGKMEIKLVTDDNHSIRERYQLKTADDQPNEKALNAFSFFVRQVLGNDRNSVDPEELKGCYIEGDVEHTVVQSKTDPSKLMTFAHIKNVKPCDTAVDKDFDANSNGLDFLG